MKRILLLCAVVSWVLPACADEAVMGEAADAALQVTVKCDKKEYMHGEPGVVYIITPTGRLKATLTVANASTKAHTLEFRSGQQYDFVIRDTKGKELKRWSAGRAFTDALQEKVVAPGETLNFTDGLSLGEVGKPLPEGDYILEGILTCHPPTSATTKFKIIPTPAR